MSTGVPIKNGIVIPLHEVEIATSRSGGAGGQHVNKTESRVTVRWNVNTTSALTPEQKERVLQNLQSRLTVNGELIINASASRSQQDNKSAALEQLATVVRAGLHVPKKRKPTRVSKKAKQARLRSKTQRSALKKLRSKPDYDN